MGSPTRTIDGDLGAPTDDLRRYRHELQSTYRYLRLAIILLTLLLFTSVGLQIISDGWQVLGSVSAYYYTPARAVFVASLCAIGTCMIVHRGRSDLEDVLLNFSGYLAFFVAFVPTAQTVADTGEETVVVPDDFVAAVTNNTWSILAVGLAAFLVQILVVPQPERNTGTRSGRAALVVTAIAYLGLACFFIFARQTFLDWGHGVAAIVLFLGIVGVVGINGVALARVRASGGATRRSSLLNRYTYGFLGMLLSAVLIIGVVRLWLEQWIFVLEAALILQFLGFWITQTVERWRDPEPAQDAMVPG
jgi:hypothetical protein